MSYHLMQTLLKLRVSNILHGYIYLCVQKFAKLGHTKH